MTHCDVPGNAGQPRDPANLTIALVGQPNVGKSTVFNMLTGLSQHVGNWPGKTVEQKTGTFRRGDGTTLNLVDLPGTYSLTANSEEERIARDYLIRERPDAVIAVVNAAALERNLYLVAELLALPLPLVLGLNMTDVAEQHGIRVEPHVLAAALGVPVIPIVATRNRGVAELADAAVEAATDPAHNSPVRPTIRPEHGSVLAAIRELLGSAAPNAGVAIARGRSPEAIPPIAEDCFLAQSAPRNDVMADYPEDWVALKLLEGDVEITALVKAASLETTWTRIHALLMQHEDAYLDIAGGRYEWIGRMMRAAVTRPKAGAVSITERLDRVATHPLAGLALLLGILGLAFWLTFAVATPIASWLAAQVLGALDVVAAAALSWAPAWLFGLVSDGLIHGVGTVFTFLPILVIFFAVLGVLEDVGYLARGAYVMDRFMHLMGLHGKSFMPLFLGFGCNVPAVLGSRIIEDRRARLLTILLAPLVPCTARLAVIAFLAPAFFGSQAALVSWALIAVNLLVLAIAGIAVNKLAFHGEHTAFIMELPLYHIPNGRTVGLYVWNNTVSFVRKAGSLILIASMVVWALSSLPGGDVDRSILAFIGRLLEPAGRLMGLGDWRVIVALLTSFFAKENTIATLGILFNVGETGAGLPEMIAAVLTPAARLALLIFQLLFIPCLATTATIKQETGSWRWMAASLLMLLGLSFGAGVGVYQVGRLVGW